MAGLWDRTMTVIKAKWNKLLNRAENPQETLDYSYEQQLQLLQNVKRGVADVVTAKKRLELQADKLEASVPKLESQARDALAHDREDLARMALERKTAAQAQLQDLDRQVSELESQQGKLEANEKALSAKIEAFRSQKEVMKAQYSAAEASVRIGEASTGIGEQMGDAGAAIQRAREKTEEMQARASAMDELIASGTLEDFTSGDQTQLDRELAAADLEVEGRRRAREDEGGDRRRLRARRSSSSSFRARLALGRRRGASPREGRDGGELAAPRRRGGLRRRSASIGSGSTRGGSRLLPTRTVRRRRSSSFSAARVSPGRTSRSTSCGPGDCIVHLADHEEHTLRGGPDGLEVLICGTRHPTELGWLPRSRAIRLGWPWVEGRTDDPWDVEAQAEPLEFGEPAPRPKNIVNVDEAEVLSLEKDDSAVDIRYIAREAGAERTGMRHYVVAPGKLDGEPHCHGAEEEFFLVLEGEGGVLLGERRSRFGPARSWGGRRGPAWRMRSAAR